MAQIALNLDLLLMVSWGSRVQRLSGQTSSEMAHLLDSYIIFLFGSVSVLGRLVHFARAVNGRYI